MNQQIHEQLSALMDGELARDQTRFLLKRLPDDSELAPRWERYQIVRQTLRRQEMGAVPAGFAAAVMLRIGQEPAAHLPATLPVWLRWGAGGAIAASVAVAALLVTHPAGDPAHGSAAPVGEVAAAAKPAAGDSPAPFRSVNAPVETAQVRFGPDLSQPVAIDPVLQPYLIRHYQAAGGAGQPAFVPYVLLAAPPHEAAAPRVQEPVSQNR